MADGIFKRLHEALKGTGEITTFTVPLNDPDEMLSFSAVFGIVSERYQSQGTNRAFTKYIPGPPDGPQMIQQINDYEFSFYVDFKKSLLTVTSNKPFSKPLFSRMMEESYRRLLVGGMKRKDEYLIPCTDMDEAKHIGMTINLLLATHDIPVL